MKEPCARLTAVAIGVALWWIFPSTVFAAGFSSGSTGADGALNPSSNATITVPPSGTFNYTTINIPAGVTVKYVRDPSGPSIPVILLATGDVTIGGTIDISGGDSLTTGTGTLGDRTTSGIGGPGGFDGGRGGQTETNRVAGAGQGPGAGNGGSLGAGPGFTAFGGGGGGYGAAGLNGNGQAAGSGGGPVYGSNLLTPLVGGSGGGGGAGATAAAGFGGTGGGGGGGAILIASSGTVNLTGSILARGGNSGSILGAGTTLDNTTTPTTGGGGSGGAIRIVAANFAGTGATNVNGGVPGTGPGGGAGGRGRTSIEIVTTGTLALGGVPTLAITSVSGVAAPALPTGTGDVALPSTDPNPATVAFAASGVPVGNTVALKLTPLRGTSASATSAPLAGSLASSTATASINIPQGISTLLASTSYTISIAMGEALRQYAGNERVEKVTLVAVYGGSSKALLTTVSGREYEVPAEVLRLVSIGG